MGQSLYQNVKTPRFFVDYFQYALTIGLINPEDMLGELGLTSGGMTIDQAQADIVKLFHLNPAQQITIPTTGFWGGGSYSYQTVKMPTEFKSGDDLNFNYSMILGHNLKDSNCAFYTEGHTGLSGGNSGFAGKNGIVNWSSSTDPPNYNGWTYFQHGSPTDTSKYQYVSFVIRTTDGYTDTKIGALSVGHYYDMPHSADLELTLTRDYSGVKRIQTRGGAELRNYEWISPPNWLREPFGLGESESNPDRRSGRRIWDLNFSFMSDSDLMADLEILNKSAIDTPEDYASFKTDESFFAQFMTKTIGGSLPFIFQPDKDDETPDGFAICTLDQSSISFRQVAPKLYNVKLRIKETW